MKEIEKDKRNIGLDLLRIFSMLMIVTLHYLGKGDFLTYEDNGYFYIITNIMEGLSIVAVNCFVLISGYFLINSKFSWKKVLKLWGETLFYSICIYIILVITGLHTFSIKEAIGSLFPIITKEYWFINVYLLMYIFSPFMNKLISQLKKEELKRLIIILLIAFCIMPSVLPIDMNFDTSKGYGIIWFVVLYFVAVWIRLYGVQFKNIHLNKKYYLVAYLCLALTVAVARIILYQKYKLSTMYNYNFILVFLASVSLFLFFKDVQIKSEKISKLITYISSLTFGVYLIHEQKVFRENVLYNKILHTELWKNSWLGLVISILLIIGSFIIYLTIEACRQKIWRHVKMKFIKNQN